MREFLEKNYNEDMEENDTVKLTIKSLLEVVQTGAKNIEIVVMTTEGEVKVNWYCTHNKTLLTHVLYKSD